MRNSVIRGVVSIILAWSLLVPMMLISPDVAQAASPIISVGDRVAVTEAGDEVAVRPSYSTGSGLIRRMPAGYEGEVISGPQYNQGYRWWYIRWVTGHTGWTADASLYGPIYLQPLPGKGVYPSVINNGFSYRVCVYDDIGTVGLRVREGPSLGATVKTRQYPGDRGWTTGDGPYVSTSEELVWWYIKWDSGAEGWSADSRGDIEAGVYLVKEGSTVLPPVTRELEITAVSDSKVYDGTPLTNSGYSITAGTLAAGHTLVSVTVTGSQTEVGSSANVPSDAVIMDGMVDVTDSYDITYVSGTLTVEEAPAGSLAISPSTDTNPVGTTHLLTATVHDQSGYVMEGVAIAWSISGVGSFSGTPENLTDINGQAHAVITSSIPGTSTVRCEATGTTFVLWVTATKIWTADVPNTWYVDDDLADYPAADFTAIQEAVDAASPGDTIIVYPGTYTENVDVYKDHLTIQSENGAETTIVRAVCGAAGIIRVTADYANISGFTVTGATGAGWCAIYFQGSGHNTLMDNIIAENARGLADFGSGGNRIIHNEILNNRDELNNTMRGIELASSNNIIEDNSFVNNGLFIIPDLPQDRIMSNTVNAKPLIYWEHESNRTIKGAGQVILSYCTNITVSNSDLSKSCIGLQLSRSNNCKVIENTYDGNELGIWLVNSQNNEIRCNNLTGNYIGMNLYGYMNNNTITNNKITSNVRCGIYSGSASMNHIYLNNFMGNPDNVEPHNSINVWNSPEQLTYTYNGNSYTSYLGNYWSDYAGGDPDGDGIGDTPYPINSDADNYSLVDPFENYGIGGTPPANQPPIASIMSLGGQPEIICADTQYTVAAAYHDLDGMEDLKYCYLRLNHPTKPLTLMWNQATDEYSAWAGEEGVNYVDVTGYTVPMYDTGYDLNWQFSINDAWPEVENAIDFGVYAVDDQGAISGWDYDDTNASFVVGTPHPPPDTHIWGTVQVTDPHGTEYPLGGVLTWLTQWTAENPYRWVAEVITDEEGDFSFDLPLSSGSYNIIAWLGYHTNFASAIFSVYHNHIQVHVVSPSIDLSAGASEEVNIDFSDSLLKVLDFTSFPPPELSSSLLPRDRLDDLAMTYAHVKQVIDFETDVLGVTPDLNLPIEVHAYSDQTNGAFYNGEIYIGDDISDYDNGNRPMNREWHESFHQLMDDTIGIPWPYPAGTVNHGGYANTYTVDSWVEGWAEFWPCVLWDDLGLEAPYLYRMAGLGHIPLVDWWLVGGPVNFEENWKAWDEQNGSSREEFAVASLLWDLYDPVDVSDREWEPIWEWYHDHLQLSTHQIWQVVANDNLQDMKDVYDALRSAGIGTDDPDEDGVDSLDELFIMHGFFADTNGNRHHDEGEEIGRAADQSRPDRRMTPGIENAYLLLQVIDQLNSTTDATIVYEFSYEPPWDYLNYTYEIPVSAATETALVYLEPSPIERPVTIEIHAIDSNGNLSDRLSVTNHIYWENVATCETGYVLQHTFEIGATEKTTILASINVDPDTLNLRNKGKYVTAYVELPPGYDVSQIDISSIRLNSTIAALPKPTDVGDHDGDAIPDLMVKFDRAAVQDALTVGEEVEVTITGEVAGIGFEGGHTINRVITPTPPGHAEWTRVTTPTTQGFVLAPDSVIVDYSVTEDGAAAYAIMYSYNTSQFHLLKSSDGAATWEDTMDALEEEANGDISWLVNVATDAEDADFVAVALEMTDLSVHVFISDDGGATFEDAGEVEDNGVYFPDGYCVSDLEVSPEVGANRNIAIGGCDSYGDAALFRCKVTGGSATAWEDATGYDGWDDDSGFTSILLTDIIFSPSWETDKTILVTTVADYGPYEVHLQCGSWGTTAGWNEYSTLGIEAVPIIEDVDIPIWLGDFETGAIAGVTVPSDYNSKDTDSRTLWVWVNYYDEYEDDYPACTIMRVDDDSADPVGPMGQVEDGELWLTNISYKGTIDEGEAIAGVLGTGTYDPVHGSPNDLIAECCYGVQVYRNDGIRDMDICCERWHDACKPPTGAFAIAVSYVGEDKAYAVSLWGFFSPYDEDAWSVSFDDGDFWNQLSLIDTKIDYISDVAVSTDCNKTVLASVNEESGCECDSVWLHAESLSEAPEYSGKWLRTWCGQLEGDIGGGWERGLLRLAPEETTGDTVYLFDYYTGNVYQNNLETLACWDPIGCTELDYVVDLAVQDSDTVYALDYYGDLAMFDEDEWQEAVTSEVDYGWTIAVQGDHILVGGCDGDVSYSDDGGETFTELEEVPADAADYTLITVAFDSYFDANDTIYAAAAGFAGSNPTTGGIYRWIIGESEEWEDLGAEDYAYTGLVLNAPSGGKPETSPDTGGVLYASYVSGGTTGAARCLTPAQEDLSHRVKWNYLTNGLTSELFKMMPRALKICGGLATDTGSNLFAIDSSDYYDMESGMTGTVWSFED